MKLSSGPADVALIVVFSATLAVAAVSRVPLHGVCTPFSQAPCWVFVLRDRPTNWELGSACFNPTGKDKGILVYDVLIPS